jgi:hypothetical protein
MLPVKQIRHGSSLSDLGRRSDHIQYETITEYDISVVQTKMCYIGRREILV